MCMYLSNSLPISTAAELTEVAPQILMLRFLKISSQRLFEVDGWRLRLIALCLLVFVGKLSLQYKGVKRHRSPARVSTLYRSPVCSNGFRIHSTRRTGGRARCCCILCVAETLICSLDACFFLQCESSLIMSASPKADIILRFTSV